MKVENNESDSKFSRIILDDGFEPFDECQKRILQNLEKIKEGLKSIDHISFHFTKSEDLKNDIMNKKYHKRQTKFYKNNFLFESKESNKEKLFKTEIDRKLSSKIVYLKNNVYPLKFHSNSNNIQRFSSSPDIPVINLPSISSRTLPNQEIKLQDDYNLNIDTVNSQLTSNEETSPTSKMKKKNISLRKIYNLANKVEKHIGSTQEINKRIISDISQNKIEINSYNYKEMYYDKKDISEIVKLNEERTCFIYNSSLKEKKQIFSHNKNNIFHQTELIGNTNPSAIYKFRNIINEKFGVNTNEEEKIAQLFQRRFEKGITLHKGKKIMSNQR